MQDTERSTRALVAGLGRYLDRYSSKQDAVELRAVQHAFDPLDTPAAEFAHLDLHPWAPGSLFWRLVLAAEEDEEGTSQEIVRRALEETRPVLEDAFRALA
jgi:hypothetical protein